MNDETEVKIRLDYKEFVCLDSRLLKLGAVYEGTTKEVNFIYRFFGLFPSLTFRLREENKDSYKLTYKGKLKPSKFKKRPEVNFRINSFFGRILKKIPAELTYYKTRKDYILHDQKVSLDYVTDLGYFIEIEGYESGIELVIKKLNLKDHKIIREGYPTLIKRMVK